MQAYELSKLIHKRMGEKGFGGKQITVYLPGKGAALIDDVVFHDSCDEFHVILKIAAVE